jgi:hypothetical protein
MSLDQAELMNYATTPIFNFTEKRKMKKNNHLATVGAEDIECIM